MIKTLKKREDFVATNKQGDHWFTKGFILQALSACESDPTNSLIDDQDLNFKNHRFGFTATKKIGNAVKRNFAKRRLRALVLENRDLFTKIAQKKGLYQFVFVARKEILEIDYQILGKELNWSLKKLGLTKKPKK
tara:strand:- start:582 stop:986 length:405 start_codon:yes stop_codon:yes gene_type:complete